MDSFNSYGRNDLSEMYPSFINLHEDESDHLLLDMDSLVPRRSSFLASRGCESTKKKCSLGDETEEIDGTGWSDKPIRSWCQEETINWLMSAASYMGQPYSSIQHSLAVPGKEIVTFTRQDFINHDPVYGDQLYDLLHSQLPSFDTIQPQSEDEYARVNSSNISDAESDNSIEIATKRLPGRPRILKTKKNPSSQGKLWEFIRDLLRNRETCPSLICWEDYSQAKFRFVKSDEVAKRWGSRKGNTKMTYEKLSRAMRYYYKSKIFLPVLGRRLVYQFGPNAKGWQTDNPNFRH
ncbi:ETS-related transcription factor Elf-5 isoform X2 [Solenopsis invicta]|uniref:ETS-related transcription factor Elf-5 isoform X2 n=1 Tax=Solenopsis invicta TaxID=13686 RepID=UPI00193E273F|nr:ETS-related transcription factor Elf-5 isoform X2 [Solenopsis invicta]